MSEPKSNKKWSCDYCTYENWPASKKCILCQAPKPPLFINEEARVEQDIYKMAPLISPDCQSSSNDNIVTSPSGAGALVGAQTNKWACQVCTYLNWPKSQKCTQCLTKRPKLCIPTQLATSSSSQEHIQPLSINVNITEGAGGGSSPGSHKNSPRTSPNSPEAAKALNNDKNKAVAARTGKWTCKACTYENWPKTTRCVMCGVARGRTFSETPSVSDNSNIGADADGRFSSCRRSPPGSARNAESSSIEIQQLGGATASPNIYQEKQDRNKTEERKLRQIRNRLRETDWLWLQACQGIVNGDSHAIEGFLAAGGDPARQVSQDEALLLNRPSAFQVGYTLVHLAIRFQREDLLAILLTASDVAAKAKKRMPPHVCPDVAADILRGVSASIRQRKGDFPCYFSTDIATFALPADIEDLPRPIQKQLFDDILDRDVQKELEVEEPIVNWSLELTTRLGSRLYALWNRTAGDCLLDSALQATWGVFDRDNTLRRALSDSLVEGANMFYPRWKESEAATAQSLHFSLDEAQWQQDWSILVSLASQPGTALEQIHVFTLAHILRRPIIVYGIKFVKSFRGENIGLARFQGVYLPLLWEPSFCWKTPIALGYTRGHFSALVPMEIDTDENIGAGANLDNNEDVQITYLPLMDSDGKLLPVHFLSSSEVGREETILREWLECCVTDGGMLVAQQKLHKRPLLVRQMVDEWLDRYRRLADALQNTRPARSSQNLSSEGESDDE